MFMFIDEDKTMKKRWLEYKKQKTSKCEEKKIISTAYLWTRKKEQNQDSHTQGWQSNSRLSRLKELKNPIGVSVLAKSSEWYYIEILYSRFKGMCNITTRRVFGRVVALTTMM